MLKKHKEGKKEEKEKIVIDFRMVFCLTGFIALVLTGLSYFFITQRETSGAETLVKFPQFSFASYVEGDFQNGLEQAAKDQFIFHDQAIAWNAEVNAGIKSVAKRSSALFRGKGFREEMVPFGKVYRMYGTDWLMNMPYTYDAETAELYQKKANDINTLATENPDVQVYVYYCTRAEDMNWFDSVEGISSYPWYQLLEDSLQDNIAFDQMKFRNFEEYANRMYRTDHHWNNVGAAVGYADILHMMSEDYDLGRAKSILRAEDYDHLLWAGSRYRECGRQIKPDAMDVFYVDQYILPEHKTLFGDKEQNIGLKVAYDKGAVNREIGFDQYLNYYGFESETISLFYEEGEHNLLMIGDSFARAIREPLSSHFQNTIFVNFRILDKVDLDQIMKEYEIDTVLFMGQQDAWTM